MLYLLIWILGVEIGILGNGIYLYWALSTGRRTVKGFVLTPEELQ